MYASQAVNHMLSGKAVERALRGHLLVEKALYALIISNHTGMDLPVMKQDVDQNETSREANERCENSTSIPADFDVALSLFEDLLNEKATVFDICESQILKNLEDELNKARELLTDSRTGKLWIQYCDMIKLLKQFIKGERTGNWDLHLQCMHDMLPYFASTGHNLYAKSVHVYLSQMQNLHIDHPDVYQSFKNGHHVLRRSDRFWGGLSTDLINEQVLVRSVKTTGGMTRGRGMDEAQRAQWLLSMPARAEFNNAMQDLTEAGYCTSEQQKQTMNSRMMRDHKDILTIMSFLDERNPFFDDKGLRNIATGVVADKSVNVDDAVNVGRKIVQSMKDQEIGDFVFKRSNQVVTFTSKIGAKVGDETISVDPQLLFQRLTAVGNLLMEDTGNMFSYELSTFPSSLFEPSGMPREANKPTLGDCIWNIGDCSCISLPSACLFVLDEGPFFRDCHG